MKKVSSCFFFLTTLLSQFVGVGVLARAMLGVALFPTLQQPCLGDNSKTLTTTWYFDTKNRQIQQIYRRDYRTIAYV
jgi:hypothetical protein